MNFDPIIYCPHCGYKDEMEEYYDYDDEEEFHCECEKCGKEFKVIARVQIDFSCE